MCSSELSAVIQSGIYKSELARLCLCVFCSQAVHDLQNSVRDGILLLRVLLEEVRRNATTEKQAIETLYVNMQEKIQEKKTELEEEVERYKNLHHSWNGNIFVS